MGVGLLPPNWLDGADYIGNQTVAGLRLQLLQELETSAMLWLVFPQSHQDEPSRCSKYFKVPMTCGMSFRCLRSALPATNPLTVEVSA